MPTGKKFKSKFIQAGLANYPNSFGVALIRKESFDKFINTLEGKPVIINHQDVTKDNFKDVEVGTVCNVWYNPEDGWYWCDGVITDETAINLIKDKGWSVSCSYNITLANDEGGLENNVHYDIEFLDGVFTHLAIVNNPRYERANIVLNSKTEMAFPIMAELNLSNDYIKEAKVINSLEKIIKNINPNEITNQDCKILNSLINIVETVQNGWITLKDKVDEDGKPLRVYIPTYIPNGGPAIDFFDKISKEKSNNITYEFERTRANISEEQKQHIKNTIDNVQKKYKIDPPLKGLNVCTIGGGCLGVACSSKTTRTVSIDSNCFKENSTEKFNKSVQNGWLARTNKDVLTSVLTHELGHAITAGTENKTFWNKIKEIKSEYVKNIAKDDIKNKDYISKYARTDKDEFVAECFAQATLLKNPSKYAKMVLDEINTHFKQSSKEYQQMKLFNAIMEVLNMDYAIKNEKEDTEDSITWVEGDGVGYCLTEEDYEERNKEVNKHTKSEIK